MSAAGDDLDGDGRMDIAIANETSQNMVVQFHEPGVNDLQFTNSPLTYALLGPLRQVLLADLNNDQRPEMIVLLQNQLI